MSVFHIPASSRKRPQNVRIWGNARPESALSILDGLHVYQSELLDNSYYIFWCDEGRQNRNVQDLMVRGDVYIMNIDRVDGTIQFTDPATVEALVDRLISAPGLHMNLREQVLAAFEDQPESMQSVYSSDSSESADWHDFGV